MHGSRLTFSEPTSVLEQEVSRPPATGNQLIYQRIRQLQVLNRSLRICGMVCMVFSVICFISGVTLMILDFDGNDDEYIHEDGVIKTRMGMFDYGVIILGVAVCLTLFTAIFWGFMCFLPSISTSAVQALTAARSVPRHQTSTFWRTQASLQSPPPSYCP